MATLSFKAASAGSASLAAIFAVGTVFLTRQIGDSFATQAEALQRETLSNEARAVRGSLDELAQIAKNIALVAGAMRSNGVTDRAAYDAALKRLLEENPAILGTWTGWEANALDARDTDFAGGSTSDATGRFPAVLEPWKRRHRARSADRLRGPRGRGLLSAAQIAEPARRHRTVHLPRGGEGHDDHVLRGTDHGGRQVPRRRRDRHRSVRHEPGRGVGPALRHRLRHPRLCSGRSGGVSGCEGPSANPSTSWIPRLPWRRDGRSRPGSACRRS